MDNNAISNLKLSDVVKVSARDVKSSFAALDLSFVDGTSKEAQVETSNAIGAFTSVLASVDKAYYKMAVLAGAINDRELFKNLVNPATEKPYQTFKELCLSDRFSRYMVNEKGAALSYPFVNQLASVGKFFYLPSVNGDKRYDVFADMSVSALIPFIPFGGTDSMPMLLQAFNPDGENPPKYDASKMTVKAARELSKRIDNRENILVDAAQADAAQEENKPETDAAQEESKPEADKKPVRDTRKGGRKARTQAQSNPQPAAQAQSNPQPAAQASAPVEKEYFIPSIWYNDGRAPLEFMPQGIDDFKAAARNVGETYKNVLILNGTHSAFAVMFNPVKPEKVDVAAAISDNLQKLYHLRAEFAPLVKPEADAESKPEADATTDTEDAPF